MNRTDDQVTVWDDAVAQADAIRHGEISATELLDDYLARIDQFDETLRGYVHVDRVGARKAAAAADTLTARVDPDELPPFHGVTLAIKDNVDVAGLPTTHSSRALTDHIAAADSPLVGRFRGAGFVIVGKTNLSEFCTSVTSSDLNGTCRNPWDIDRTVGGSSGGAGAVLAAGLCAVAHGTDGGGSVRIPASWCGVVGVKPTRGLVNFGPEIGNAFYANSVDGMLTRSVRDAAATLDAMVGSRDGDRVWSPRPSEPYAVLALDPPPPLRIAVTTDAPFGTTTAECADAALAVADVLAALGHHVETAAPAWSTMLAAANAPLSVPGPAALVGEDDLELVEPRNRAMVRTLTQRTILEHSVWIDRVRAAAQEFLTFWDNYDVLLTPTAGIVAPPVEWAQWDMDPDVHLATLMSLPNFAQPFNLSGQPALSVPAAWSDSGLPIGIQLAGRRLDEALLLRVARQLEVAMPWADRRPSQFA